MSDILIQNKTLRDKSEQKIILKIDNDKVEFELISSKLNKADELFMEYEGNKKISDLKKWEKIKKIIELVEINHNYNFEILKLQQRLANTIDKKEYDYNFNQLSPTLSENDYYFLTNKTQENPSIKIFNLINTFYIKEEDFDEKTKKINFIPYNIPLIEGNERLRINYYFQIFSHYENALNDNQKKYLLNPEIAIDATEKEQIDILKSKYDALKLGIESIKSLIPKMEIFFNNVNLEDNNLNIKMFTFILYISDIFTRIPFSGIKPMFITNFFQKEIDSTLELKGYDSTENIIIKKKNSKFPDKYGIRKKEEKYQYEIFNEFDSIPFDGRNYILENLIIDYQENCFIPLDILLLRNQSLEHFIKNNENFLNVNDKIYSEFKNYFKTIIKSKCILEALKTNKDYDGIIELIKNDSIINKFLEKKYLKSLPLFEFSGSGYTNKDILVSGVSGFPFMIYNYKPIKTIEDYKELKNIIILFNIGMKLITLLHEFIIHFCFGYLNYLSDGKILSTSPKKDNKNVTNDGGLFFEQILFGKQYGNITAKEILVLLNGGDSFNSINNLQTNLAKDINFEEFQAKSQLLTLFLKKHTINFKKLKRTNINSYMKSFGNEMYIERDIMKIIPSQKRELPYNYVKRSKIYENK